MQVRCRAAQPALLCCGCRVLLLVVYVWCGTELRVVQVWLLLACWKAGWYAVLQTASAFAGHGGVPPQHSQRRLAAHALCCRRQTVGMFSSVVCE